MSHPLLTISAYENDLTGNNKSQRIQIHEKPLQNRRCKFLARPHLSNQKSKFNPRPQDKNRSACLRSAVGEGASRPVQPGPTKSNHPPPAGKEIGKETVKFLAIF